MTRYHELTVSFLAAVAVSACSTQRGNGPSGGGGKADGPGDIVLEVDRRWVPPGGKVTATVEALDDRGRLTQAWSLQVTPETGVRIVPAGPGKAFVSFDVKGLYRIRAVNETSGDWDEARVRVDEAGCRIEVSEPARGAALVLAPDRGQVRVAGRVADELERHRSIQVNGSWVPVSADGSFETWVTPKLGMNRIVIESPDSLGLPCRRVQTFLAAQDYAAERGLSARVRLGPGTVALLSALVSGLFNGAPDWGLDPVQLADYLPHPTTTTRHAGVEIVIDIQRIQIGRTRVALAPKPDERIGLYGTVDTPTRVWGNAHFLGSDHDFLVTIQDMQMAATYRLDVTAETAEATAEEVVVHVGETDIDIEWWPDFLAGDTQQQVHDAVESALRSTVPKLVSKYLSGVAGQDAIPYLSEALGLQTTVTWAFRLEGLRTDSLGIEAEVGLSVAAERGWGVPNLPGAPILGASQEPRLPAQADLGLAVSTDALNHLLYALWRAGGMSRALDVSRYLPDLSGLPFEPTSAEAAVNALLPPVVLSGPTGSLRVEFGAVQVDLYLESRAGALNATAYVTGALNLAIRSVDQGYQVEASDLDLDFDLDRVSLAGVDLEAIEAYVRPLVGAYLPDILEHTALLPTVRVRLAPLGLEGAVELADLALAVDEDSGLTLTGRAVRTP